MVIIIVIIFIKAIYIAASIYKTCFSASSAIANMLREAQNEGLTSQYSVLKYIGESILLKF